jgi:hypothetical protein
MQLIRWGRRERANYRPRGFPRIWGFGLNLDPCGWFLGLRLDRRKLVSDPWQGYTEYRLVICPLPMVSATMTFRRYRRKRIT